MHTNIQIVQCTTYTCMYTHGHLLYRVLVNPRICTKDKVIGRVVVAVVVVSTKSPHLKNYICIRTCMYMYMHTCIYMCVLYMGRCSSNNIIARNPQRLGQLALRLDAQLKRLLWTVSNLVREYVHKMYCTCMGVYDDFHACTEHYPVTLSKHFTDMAYFIWHCVFIYHMPVDSGQSFSIVGTDLQANTVHVPYSHKIGPTTVYRPTLGSISC
jgi:hypothetical protein